MLDIYQEVVEECKRWGLWYQKLTRVDGFRLDAVKYFYYNKHSKNVDVLSNYDCMTVGETVFSSLEDMKLLTAEDRKELSMVFNFDHTSVDNFLGVKWLMRKFKLTRFKKILDKYTVQGFFYNDYKKTKTDINTYSEIYSHIMYEVVITGNKFKLLVVILLLTVITGCQAKYEVKIYLDGSIKESATLLEKQK